MPNAKDIKIEGSNYLFLGVVGSGKTVLWSTIPGRKFCYNFDPGGLKSVRGVDINYEEFLPKDISTKMITSGISDTYPPLSQRVYNQWENDFETRLNSRWFTDKNVTHKDSDGTEVQGGVDVVVIDSASTWTNMIIDELQIRNNRVGLPPDFEHEFHTAMNLISRVVRTLTSLGITVVMCVHERTIQDKVTQRVMSELALVGQLRQSIPLLFDEIYHLEGRDEGGKAKFKILTRPTSIYQIARTRVGRGIYELWEDVTVDFSKPIEGQGIAALMLKAKKGKK
jgi:hypothetical protein